MTYSVKGKISRGVGYEGFAAYELMLSNDTLPAYVQSTLAVDKSTWETFDIGDEFLILLTPVLDEVCSHE